MTDDDLTVHLTRRTLPEQVEWLVQQVALLTACVMRLERDAEALVLAIQSLENRMTTAERAIPWKAPKTGTKPPVSRYRR